MKHLKCSLCNEKLSYHGIIDTEPVAMFECPTGDRRIVVFVVPEIVKPEWPKIRGPFPDEVPIRGGKPEA